MEDNAMYFPYLRGRQYELLALKELAINNLISNKIIPIIEPVRLSPTLINMMEEFIKSNHTIAIIRNPAVGTFISDLNNVKENTKEAGYKEKFKEQYKNQLIIKSIIMQNNAKSLLDFWEKEKINKNDLLVINTNREFLDFYEQSFKNNIPKYILIPDESAFRRKVPEHRILVDNKFEKQKRNEDYKKETDKFFSDDHLYYKDEKFIGFSDYSVVGDEYLEAGFAPYAIAIHIVYFAKDNTLRIKHFVSDSNDDITNPALKYYQAVSKLANWYKKNPSQVEMTFGLNTFLQHFKSQIYPGLGTIKKLSIMHHIELMGKYLEEV